MNTAEMTPLALKSALVIGLGQTGAASARWLKRQGYEVRLLDTRDNPPGIESLRADLGQALVAQHFGATEPEYALFEGIALAVISPGLAPTQEPVGQWLARASAAGAQVLGEIELFAQALEQLDQQHGYKPRILGVTGTNGKTTVTALTRRMAQAAGLTACAAGNISPAALDALMQALDQDDLPEVWVLELSSFQLVTTSSLRMTAAVVLNVSQDHLDWHGTMQHYCEAKAKIYAMANIKIVNRDDPSVVAMVATLDDRSVRGFGAGEPVLTGDVGVQSNHDVAWLVSAEPTEFDDAPRVRRRKNEPVPPRGIGRIQRLMPADALPLVGQHNVMNVLAASALVRALDVGWAPILKAASDYEGEPHRMRFVRTIREVDFFNDSKGTNVGAAVAGIEGLARRVVLVAGGVAKGQDFGLLGKTLARTGSAAVLIGIDAPLLQAAFEAQGVVCTRAVTISQALEQAFELAQPGDAVVLSPACASFDMFRNYGHRGDVFVDAVLELALTLGEVA